MKRIRPVPEPGVIAEFLKNEFYHGEFHRDRHRFEQLVMKADINNERDNALRRALLFRRRGHMWRELPADTEWWQIEFETEDLEMIRVFPRAQWRRVSRGNYQLTDIARRIKSEKFAGKTGEFIAKVQALSCRMRTQHNNSSVLLIGIDESHPFTILEGNHRLTAAMLVSPEIVRSRFQIFCGLSPNMARSCWYETNFANLWRYAQNRFRNLMYDREADVNRVMKTSAPVSTGETALDASVGVGKAFPGSNSRFPLSRQPGGRRARLENSPMMIRRNLIYPLLAVLAFVLCGLPEALAQESTTPPPTERSPQSPQGQQPSSRGVRVDPSQAPIVPPASTGQQQPPAPTQQEPIYPEGPAPQTTPVPQPGQREPLGAATAGSVRTQGGGASRPAGSAIAPAKQHQVRSLLIKFGAIAAAGVALGTVYALSKGTPSVPPNSGR